MAPRSRLAQYVFDRISERGETPEEFAVRNGINPSGLYKFLRGAYAEPRQTTLDKIASGLNLTPAELLVATGKGAIEDDPEDAELLALIRRLPEEHRPTVKTILRELSRRREHHVTKHDEGFDRDKSHDQPFDERPAWMRHPAAQPAQFPPVKRVQRTVTPAPVTRGTLTPAGIAG